MSGKEYKSLLRDSLGDTIGTASTGRKKRKRISNFEEINGQNAAVSSDGNDKTAPIVVDSDSIDSEDFEDVDLSENVDFGSAGGGSADLVDSDEEQGYDYNFLNEKSDEFDANDEGNDNHGGGGDKTGTITIPINKIEENEKKRKKFSSIPKEERVLRAQVHRLCVGLMMMHGVVRNRWCNDGKLQAKLRQYVPTKYMDLMNRNYAENVSTNVKSRRFLDALQLLMNVFGRKFKVSGQGIVLKNWNELTIDQPRVERNVTREKFRRLVTWFRGTRDLGAQGFVAFLRSVGLNARLVFSLQPPDYTLISELPKIEDTKQSDVKHVTPPKTQESTSIVDNLGSSKMNMLKLTRNKVALSVSNPKRSSYFEESPFPVFWAEVWDPFSNKWVSVDPLVLKTIETAPKRKKSKFQPPSSDTRNTLTYVIAYDKQGGVKDVTRRYSHYFNARTVKKRIQFKSEEDDIWYSRLVSGCCLKRRRNKTTRIDILESKEFHYRDLAEGMPNNIADFKNHPIYALESQLKQSEIIYPKDDTSRCGYFRAKLTSRSRQLSDLVPVFKRSHVYPLRSARGWFMHGRILKVGEQPLKKKAVSSRSSPSSSDDQDEEISRFYAEFQTQLYIPPPITNGKIPKNAHGNIDIYVPSMIPKNGYLIDTRGRYSMKIAEEAAKIIGIDYARAVVGFEFGGPKKKQRKTPTAMEGGFLVALDYKEAMVLVMNTLLEQQEEAQQEAFQLNSLKLWKFFLTKLRISKRLEQQHGHIDELDQDSQHEPIHREPDQRDSTVELSLPNYAQNQGDPDSDSDSGHGVAQNFRSSANIPRNQIPAPKRIFSLQKQFNGTEGTRSAEYYEKFATTTNRDVDMDVDLGAAEWVDRSGRQEQYEQGKEIEYVGGDIGEGDVDYEDGNDNEDDDETNYDDENDNENNNKNGDENDEYDLNDYGDDGSVSPIGGGFLMEDARATIEPECAMRNFQSARQPTATLNETHHCPEVAKNIEKSVETSMAGRTSDDLESNLMDDSMSAESSTRSTPSAIKAERFGASRPSASSLGWSQKQNPQEASLDPFAEQSGSLSSISEADSAYDFEYSDSD